VTTDDDLAVPAAADPSRRPPPPGLMDVAEYEWDPSNGPRPLRGRMSRLAIASFVLGLLGGLLGPIFGVVALLQIKRTGERGKPFAVAGILLFVAWALVSLFAVVMPLTGAESGVRELQVGSCFGPPGAGPGSTTAPKDISKVPCDQPHHAELAALLPPYERRTDEKYPGGAVLSQRAETGCRTRVRSYVLDPVSLPADAHLRWYIPSRSDWRAGPTIVCYLAGEPTPLTRSLRQDAALVKPEQLRYLVAVRDFNELAASLKALDPNTPLTTLHDMVAKADGAHSKMLLRLRIGPWPDAAQPAVERLLIGMAEAGNLWRAASQATDRTQLLDLVDQAGRHQDQEADLAVRRALGLSTVQGQPAR
jgi:hypothetical protein